MLPRLLLPLLILLPWTTPALAQDEEIPIYTVEVLVFENRGAYEEAYRAPALPVLDEAVDLLEEQRERPPAPGVLRPSAAPAVSTPEARPLPERPLVLVDEPSPFQALAPEELTLVDAAARLEAQPSYELLLHFGWRQPASPFGEPVPVRIHGGESVHEPTPAFLGLPLGGEQRDAIEELDGTIALERGRYLHLRVDLLLNRPLDKTARQVPAPLRTPGLERGIARDFRSYRLVERRQIVEDSVNYFDHRHFGLIAVVREWQSPEEENGDGDGLATPLEQVP